MPDPTPLTCTQCQGTNDVRWYSVRMSELWRTADMGSLVHQTMPLCRPHRVELHVAIEAALKVACGETKTKGEESNGDGATADV